MKHAPKQAHSSIQGSEVLQYLHGGQQDLLQQHLTSSLHNLDTSGRVVQIRIHHSSSFLFHPHETLLGTSCCGISVLFQMYIPWYIAPSVCWINASCVGGMFSICLPLANNFFLASFTNLHSIVVLQRITSNLSTSSIAKLIAKLKRSGQFANSLNIFVKEGKTSQVSQAFFFPILLKDQTVSHPVKA